MDKHRNPNGTYNGAAVLAELSGLSEKEIRWTFERMKALKEEGKSSTERKAIIREEVKGKPWEK